VPNRNRPSPARSHQSPAQRTVTADNQQQRAAEDLQIDRCGTMLGVPEVQLDSLRPRQRGTAVHLRVTGPEDLKRDMLKSVRALTLLPTYPCLVCSELFLLSSLLSRAPRFQSLSCLGPLVFSPLIL
jgi:hypothetical protein